MYHVVKPFLTTHTNRPNPPVMYMYIYIQYLPMIPLLFIQF